MEHIVHHQVRQALLGAPAIEQLHNIGVVERRQCLPLVPETARDFVDAHALLH